MSKGLLNLRYEAMKMTAYDKKISLDAITYP
jgi:hypothetical protein